MKATLTLQKLPRVIAGFPGVGKSTLFRLDPDMFADSDSSQFPKDAFPANYMEHIKTLLADTDKTIFVSTHQAVRDALAESGIPFLLVYPSEEMRGDFLDRYKSRGSPQQFVDMMNNKFDDFVGECNSFEASNCKKYVLNHEVPSLVKAMRELGYGCVENEE